MLLLSTLAYLYSRQQQPLEQLSVCAGSLDAFSALMNEATDLLLLSVAAAAKSEKYFDIYQAIGRMTLQVVGTTAFG